MTKDDEETEYERRDQRQYEEDDRKRRRARQVDGVTWCIQVQGLKQSELRMRRGHDLSHHTSTVARSNVELGGVKRQSFVIIAWITFTFSN